MYSLTQPNNAWSWTELAYRISLAPASVQSGCSGAGLAMRNGDYTVFHTTQRLNWNTAPKFRLSPCVLFLCLLKRTFVCERCFGTMSRQQYHPYSLSGRSISSFFSAPGWIITIPPPLPPATEFFALKTQSFIEFPFILISNSKVVDRRHLLFLFRVLILPPSLPPPGPCYPGRRTTSTLVGTPLLLGYHVV